MRINLARIVVVVLSILPSIAAGGAPTGPFGGDAIVAIVKAVDDANATFGNPPRVRLEIVEVLRGDPQTDRSHAIWGPPDHDIDTGVVKENPRYKEWAKTPMKGPKVGEKYIIWGWGYAQDRSPMFYVANGGRYPFSYEKRQWAIDMIDRDRKSSLAYQEKMEAEKQAHLDAVKKWRAGVSSDDIKQYAAKAEFIGVGRLSSAINGSPEEMCFTFQVTGILKGQQKQKYKDAVYFATFVIPTKLYYLLDLNTDYVVFLQDTPKLLSAAAASYATIPLGDGVVIADEQTTKALAGFVIRKPISASMPATSQPGKHP